MVSSTLPAIPWAHSSSDFGSVWRWETPHFIITVNGDHRSCYYTIADKSAAPGSPPRPLADGTAATFEQAERQIRETIGKAYHPSLGYQPYAGGLATTFTLATGQRVDLGEYADQLVTLTVSTPDGQGTTDYTGTVAFEHYELILTTGNIRIRISPTYIHAIRLIKRTTASVVPTRVNRTVEGQLVPGCTGVPGFIGGTVEHTGIPCPIHENA